MFFNHDHQHYHGPGAEHFHAHHHPPHHRDTQDYCSEGYRPATPPRHPSPPRHYGHHHSGTRSPHRSRALSHGQHHVPLIDRIPDHNAGNMPYGPPSPPPPSSLTPGLRRSPSPPPARHDWHHRHHEHHGQHHPPCLTPGFSHGHRRGPPSPGRHDASMGPHDLPPPPAYQEEGPLIHQIPPMGTFGNNGPVPPFGMHGGNMQQHHRPHAPPGHHNGPWY
jgi:hypothetical protein